MSVLAYSELLKRITGIHDEELEEPFKILGRHNTTETRLAAIKTLARNEPISLGMLLHSAKLPRGGGSYLNIRKFFLELEKEGLLSRNEHGNKTEWAFSEKGALLKRFILS